jgi:hypothetical protein
MAHPLQVVDIGIASSPPTNGVFYITDIKFDQHQTFAGAERLRLVEFKIEQQGLPEHEWWLDDIGLNLAGRGPLSPGAAAGHFPGTLRPEPLAGAHVGALCPPPGALPHGGREPEPTVCGPAPGRAGGIPRRYGGAKGPILPVHTRNDLENIALCGEENFGKFCWWPKYRDYGKLQGYWPFNGAPTDAGEYGNHAVWVGTPRTPPACASRGTPAPTAPGCAISPCRTMPASTSPGISPWRPWCIPPPTG